MTLLNSYLHQIFIEFLQHNFLVPLDSDITLHAMFLFGGYELSVALIVAGAAMLLSCALNYGIGYMIIARFQQKLPLKTQALLMKGNGFFAGAGVVLVFFFWLPLAGVLPLIAGVFRAPFLRVMGVVILGALAYLARYL
jgi:membrane protein YqaA with SNARE-associated domain